MSGDYSSFTQADTYYVIALPTEYFYHANAQGNVVALTNASGTIVEKFKYDIYGRLTEAWAWNGSTMVQVVDGDSSDFIEMDEYAAVSLIDNPYLFQGRRLDEESGLYYFRNRQYDPEHGRFISRDPSGPVDGPNLYAFVNNNPINYIDPMGLDAIPFEGSKGYKEMKEGMDYHARLYVEQRQKWREEREERERCNEIQRQTDRMLRESADRERERKKKEERRGIEIFAACL